MANSLNIGLDRVKLEYDGIIPENDEDYVQALVDKGVRVLLADCPGLLARVKSGATDPELAQDAVVDAVLRVLRDDDPTIQSESEGGYSYSKRALAASPDIWYTDRWLARLGCTKGEEAGPGTARVGMRRGWALP
ncbi:Gp19/Gp15/Gp42 family protein [Kocuria salsicia]|uniref:Gp19/Gp15/Gp42 family protein n=1 Tax=Kocuria salsicia TaxID=664639 RepID=UPI00119F2B91|nr:Gp19/Gp15/Gp42 family protein [Kocuria salsicia]